MEVFIRALCMGIAILGVFAPIHPRTMYHIVSTILQISNCSHCITLPQFTNNPTRYASSNIIVKVTSGIYSLNKDYTSMCQILSIFQFYPCMQNDTNSTPGPVIICNNSNFAFTNISEVKLSGLTLIGCTGNRIDHEYVNQAVLESSKIEGKNDSKSLQLLRVI